MAEGGDGIEVQEVSGDIKANKPPPPVVKDPVAGNNEEIVSPVEKPPEIKPKEQPKGEFFRINKRESIEHAQDIESLRQNKNRFKDLGFDVENINFYVGPLAPKFGKTFAFSEMIVVDKSVFQKDVPMQDFIACHEMVHALYSQRLFSKFFDSYPELQEDMRFLVDQWLILGKEPPSELEPDFIEKLGRDYGGKLSQKMGTGIDLDESIAALNKFIQDTQEFKPLSTNPEIFEEYKRFGALGDGVLLGRENPFSSEKEYEDQATATLFQLGEFLVKEIEKNEAKKYGITTDSKQDIEEGACNYLAMKLLNLSSEDIQRSYGKIDGIFDAQEFDRKLGGKIEPMVEAIRNGKLLELYQQA